MVTHRISVQALRWELTTRGPSWGHPMLVLGALGSFLEPFGGHSLPKLTTSLENLTYPHEGPCVEPTGAVPEDTVGSERFREAQFHSFPWYN